MDPIKLQKYFTDCGILSRRAAEEEIRRGKVLVNGSRAELGMRIDPERDEVTYNGKPLRPVRKERICILLNKPRGYLTTLSDDRGRRTVADLVRDVGCRVYPIGRLDMDSDGLLLLTNDGELANRLTHPRHEIPKIYRVKVKGKVSEAQLALLRGKMTLDGYEIQPVTVTVISPARNDTEHTMLEMTLFEGRNRQIRKMCEKVQLKISRLTRIAIGSIRLGTLPEGKWRRLSKKETEYLKTSHK